MGSGPAQPSQGEPDFRGDMAPTKPLPLLGGVPPWRSGGADPCPSWAAGWQEPCMVAVGRGTSPLPPPWPPQ